MRLTWPLTGRSEEMRLIAAALWDPNSSGILIRGAAGVGKSRIAREALDAAALRGSEVRWVAGTSSARSLPLGAVAAWSGRGSDSLELVSGAIRALSSAPPGKTVVVGVDDVALLDDLSTFVVHQIIERRAAKVVLTLRDGEPIPTSTHELWKTEQFYRLDLQPLSYDETASLVSATLGGSVEPTTAERLWQLTRGNALYLRNLVDVEVAEKRLARQHGYWRWTGDPVVPPGLVELIESRIGALPEPISDVLDVLAVGEPIDLAVLMRITDPAAVEAADMRGLIMLDHIDARMEARIAHPLYGEIRRERAAPTRLRRLRGLVAAQLAAADNRDDRQVVVRRASLSLESDLKQDPDLLSSGAQGAAWLGDLPLADRLAAAAIRAGAGVDASFVRAHALQWLSRGQDVDAVLAEVPTNELTDAEHAMLVFMRAINRFFQLADPAGAKKLIDDASHTTAPQYRGFIDAFLTLYWASSGRPDRARTSSRGLALQQLPQIAGAMASWALAVAAGDAGRATEALASADAGVAIATHSFNAHMHSAITDARLDALLLSGRTKEAFDSVERLRQQVRDLPGPTQVFSAAVAGRAALGCSRLDTACALLEPAVGMLTTSGDTSGWGYRFQLPHTVALGMRGAADEAAASLVALEKNRHPSWRYLDYELALATAWAEAAQGAVSDAIRILLSAAETARANGQFAAEVVCLQTATQFGDTSRASRLRELEAIVEGPRVGVAARLAAALGAGDAAELVVVSEEFDRMGDVVAAVDAAAHAAIMYRKQGLNGSALGCSTRAEALADQCGGASTPALRQAAEPLPLSDREREVVMLIGQGLSSRDAAARLTLSVRTVEGHIYRAMAKTGVTTREELAALLRGGNPTASR